MIGGFAPVFVLGGIGGTVARAIARGSPTHERAITLAWAAIVATAAVLLLAYLEDIIGPW